LWQLVVVVVRVLLRIAPSQEMAVTEDSRRASRLVRLEPRQSPADLVELGTHLACYPPPGLIPLVHLEEQQAEAVGRMATSFQDRPAPMAALVVAVAVAVLPLITDITLALAVMAVPARSTSSLTANL
jgi:hypothetical protein